MAMDNKNKQTPPKWQMIVASVCLVIASAILILVVVFPDLNAQQYVIIKVVLAASTAGITGVFTGFIEINGEVSKIPVRAGGAIAVFVIVLYFTLGPHDASAPPDEAAQQQQENPSEVINIKQTQNGDDGIQIGVNEGTINIGDGEKEQEK